MVGYTAKRTLQSIQKVMAGGLDSPAVLFTYQSASGTNACALVTITYPKGAQTFISYQQKQLPLCSRSLSIDNPFANGTPRVWFGGITLCWPGTTAKASSISAYTWIGRWQVWQPPQPIVPAFVDLSNFHCLIEEDLRPLLHRKQWCRRSLFGYFTKTKRSSANGSRCPQIPCSSPPATCRQSAGISSSPSANQDTLGVSRYTWNALGSPGIIPPWRLVTESASKPLRARRTCSLLPAPTTC